MRVVFLCTPIIYEKASVLVFCLVFELDFLEGLNHPWGCDDMERKIVVIMIRSTTLD